ncbi:MAG: hypothetical protein QOD92_3975 [Acidimicrobiaceae bacterium]|jgi:hypothetical protein
MLLALVAVMTLNGCECRQGGPVAGRTAQGDAAIGWEVEGGELIHQVRLVQGEAVLWQIDAVDTSPRVVVVGKSSEGFTTTLPLQPPIEPSAATSVVVDYKTHRGMVTYRTFTFPAAEISALSEAKVSKLECGLDVGGMARWVGWLVVWVAVFGFILVLGATGLLAAIRRAIRGAPLDP